MEQTSHRPPITNFIFDGPNNMYHMYGWSSFIAKAWVNSAALQVEGKKVIIFNDGQKIEWNSMGDQFLNIFFGTLGH